MKSRNQIYRGEGERLLKLITTYHALQYEQVLQFFIRNRDSLKSLITSLIKQGRIYYDQRRNLLCDSPEASDSPDYGMIAAVWVLLDFKDAVVYHTSGEFPVKLHFFSKNEAYEVIYVGLEQEILISHVLNGFPADDVNRLVILESEQQASRLSRQGNCLLSGKPRWNCKLLSKSKRNEVIMDKTTIFQRIQKVENEVALLNNTLFALKSTDIVKYGANYTELSTNATLRAERIACQLRNLVLFTDFKGNSTYMIQAADALGIKISYEDRIFSATLPGLLPKRRLHTNMAFLRDPLHATLKEFLRDHEVEPYKECVICFCFVYDRSLPKRRVKDYDNLELKTILDVISTYVLFDDSGLYCDSHYTTELGETDQIIVTIMEKKRFPEWLMNREKHKIAISEKK